MDNIIDGIEKINISNEIEDIVENLINNIKLPISYINNRILAEYNDNINKELDFEKMVEIYKSSNSVKNKIELINKILDNNNVKNKNNILNELTDIIIPAGTKAVYRGIKFNKIIQEYINNLNLGNDFIIEFEKQHKKYKTDEIPDWYIYHKNSNKILIGMNQIDLWNGGAQINRGYKYLFNNNNKYKIICVVCNKCYIKNMNSKKYILFNKGYLDDSLCYINNLENIILNYFK